jgi:hypothetical protein
MTTLLTIDNLFPNLENIELSGSGTSYSIFHYMLTENNKFSNLKIIPTSANRNQDEMYLKCLDFIRNRVINIDFFEDANNSRNLSSISRDKFVDYPELKHISIRIPTNNLQLENLIQYLKPLTDSSALVSLQELSLSSTLHSSSTRFFASSERDTLVPTSTLKSLYIILNDNSSRYHSTSRCSNCDGYYCHCIQDNYHRHSSNSRSSSRSNHRSTGSNYYDSHRYNQSSRHSSFRCFSLSEEFMLFLMSKFPRLNSFRLEGKIAQFEIAENLNVVFPQFIKYLCEMPEFC